jgi:hypothetical protein
MLSHYCYLRWVLGIDRFLLFNLMLNVFIRYSLWLQWPALPVRFAREYIFILTRLRPAPEIELNNYQNCMMDLHTISGI